MAKEGFKTITVSDRVYDRFEQVWQTVKKDMQLKGVNSFSGYVTYLMEECVKTDQVFSKYQARFEVLDIEKGRIILKDNHLNRIIEITLENTLLWCQHCDTDHCSHVGFCYSLHQIYTT